MRRRCGIVGLVLLAGCGERAPSAPSAPDVASPASSAPVTAGGDEEGGRAATVADPFPSTPVPTGAEALAAAQRLGMPLLVLLAPADDAARADRARVVTVLLQSDLLRARAPLVLAHVVVLGAEDLDAIAPGASASAPFAVLVETDGRGGALQIVPWPAALEGPHGLVSFDVARRDQTDDAPAPDRAFWNLVRAVRSGLVGDDATQARREAQRVAAGQASRGTDLRRAAAEILRRSAALPDAWRLHPIPGTRWVPRPPADVTYDGPNPAWCGTPGPTPWGWGWELPDDAEFEDIDYLDGGTPKPLFGDGPRRRPGPSRRDPRVVDAEDGAPSGPATPLPLSPARLEFLPPAR